MTGTNHAITGAIIGICIDRPLLAIPLAFVSHFVLDALPHFGQKYENRTNLFKAVVSVDTILMVFLFTVLVVSSQWLLIACAITAMSPDFAWIYRFTIKENFGRQPMPPLNKFNQFHVNIQKYESSEGMLFEIAWSIILGIVLSRLI